MLYLETKCIRLVYISMCGYYLPDRTIFFGKVWESCFWWHWKFYFNNKYHFLWFSLPTQRILTSLHYKSKAFIQKLLILARDISFLAFVLTCTCHMYGLHVSKDNSCEQFRREIMPNCWLFCQISTVSYKQTLGVVKDVHFCCN